ncbi:hypothetical protein HZS_7525 [Henneguya salminicola]|nr:hypothetical protein HZS_7525 [Henneguya salminicola]
MLECLFILYLCATESVYFSTKTAYEFVGNIDTSPIFPESHNLIYVRYLGRHGSRYPSYNDMMAIQNTMAILSNISKNYQSYIDISNLESDKSKDNELSAHGIKQMNHIGKRFRTRFNHAFDSKKFSAHNLRFESTCRSRAIHSMISFIDGMFKIDDESKEIPRLQTFSCANDFLYRFFDFCPLYTSTQKCLKTYVKEEEKFFKTKFMKNVVQKISAKLGLVGSNLLTPTQIKSIYFLCAYGIINNNGSPDQGPCRLFDQESFDIFDYLLDIKNYYKRANSLDINIEVSCELFYTMYTSIVKALQSCPTTCSKERQCGFWICACRNLNTYFGSRQRGYFGFYGDSDKGYANNDPKQAINANNYEHLKAKRKFKGGYFSPMGGNILFAVGCSVDGSGEVI